MVRIKHTYKSRNTRDIAEEASFGDARGWRHHVRNANKRVESILIAPSANKRKQVLDLLAEHRTTMRAKAYLKL